MGRHKHKGWKRNQNVNKVHTGRKDKTLYTDTLVHNTTYLYVYNTTLYFYVATQVRDTKSTNTQHTVQNKQTAPYACNTTPTSSFYKVEIIPLFPNFDWISHSLRTNPPVYMWKGFKEQTHPEIGQSSIQFCTFCYWRAKLSMPLLQCTHACYN